MTKLANAYGRPRAYVSFQVRLTPDLKERLARKSYESGFSQASIVIAALQHYLEAGLIPQKGQVEDDEEETDKDNRSMIPLKDEDR